MDTQIARVARKYVSKRAARPIPIDKAYLKRLAQESADKVLAWVNKETGIGSREWVLTPFWDLRQGLGLHVRMPDIEISRVIRKDGRGWVSSERSIQFWVTCEKKATKERGRLKVVRSGRYTTWEDDSWLSIFLHGDLTGADLDGYRRVLAGELYSVLLHEVTHIVEMAGNKVTESDHTRGLSRAEHTNHPLEVRAYMQQVADEVEGFGNFREGLHASPTFRGIRRHLTEANRRLLVRGVYRHWRDERRRA